MGLTLIPRCATDTATLTSTPAAVSGLGPDNLQLSDRGLVWRVLGDTAELKTNLPSPARIGGVVLWRHTLSAAATWRVRLYEGADYTGALLYDSGALQAVPSKTLGDLDWGVDALGAAVDGSDYSYVLLPTDTVPLSMRIDITDTGAAAIQVGRLFAGPLIRPSFGFAWDSELKFERETKRSRTASGGVRVESSVPWRVLKLDLEWITDDERTTFANLLRDTGDARELWLSARTGDSGRLETDHALLGVLSGNPSLTRRQGLRYTTTIELEES